MEKTNNERLRTIHILYILVVAVLAVGIAWGALSTQQGTNSDEIKKKVDKEVFEVYIQAQTNQFHSLETSINNGFNRIDSRLDAIEEK